MATSLSVTITHALRAKRIDASDLNAGETFINHTTALTLTNGYGANQADVSWSDTRALTAGGSEVLDLAGVLTNMHGEVATFAKLKVIKVSADINNPYNIQVLRHAAQGLQIFNAAGAGVMLPPGGVFSLSAGGVAGLASVVGGSADLLTLVNLGSLEAVAYSITLIGTSQ